MPDETDPLSAGLSPPSSRFVRGLIAYRYLVGTRRLRHQIWFGTLGLTTRSQTVSACIYGSPWRGGAAEAVIETEITPRAISRPDAVTRLRCARHYRHTSRRQRGRAELDDYEVVCATFTGEAVRAEPNRSSDHRSYAFRHQITPKCRSASSIASRFSCGHGSTSRSWRARSASRSVGMP